MQINNTKTRKKETFRPLSDREVKIYYCGPTVYNYAHIGNLRTYVFEDVVVKTLKFLGYNVKTTMNITDVDDKTIRDSIKAGETLSAFTEKYTNFFLEDIEKLGIQKADNIVKVTQLIPEMVRMINTLLRRGFAYIAEDNSVYYNISKFQKYGNFANLDMKKLKSNARVDNDEYDKSSVSDFVLWKAWKPEDGQNYWEETFEYPPSIVSQDSTTPKTISIKGRPGWHIECSACNMKYFGAQIDIHMGGEDLIFPHHQNEIAQTEACTGKEFSQYWLHSGHLMVNGKKMSKSLGNFYTLKDLEQKFQDIPRSLLYRAIRLSFINGKFRESIDFTFDKLKANLNTVEHIDTSLKNLYRYTNKNTGVSEDFREAMQNFIARYIAHLEDDFNMVESLVVFHEFVKFVNKGISEDSFTGDEKKSIIDMFKTFNQICGILDFDIGDPKEIPKNILEKINKRNQAKKSKDFDTADAIREEVESMGYKIIDSKEGTTIEKI